MKLLFTIGLGLMFLFVAAQNNTNHVVKKRNHSIPIIIDTIIGPGYQVYMPPEIKKLTIDTIHLKTKLYDTPYFIPIIFDN